jgi:hypothetical protein
VDAFKDDALLAKAVNKALGFGVWGSGEEAKFAAVVEGEGEVPEADDKEEGGELEAGVVVKLVNDEVINALEKGEGGVLGAACVEEEGREVKEVGVGDKDEGWSSVRELGVDLLEMLVGVSENGGELVGVVGVGAFAVDVDVLEASGVDANDLVGEVVGGAEGLPVLGVLFDEGVGGGDDNRDKRCGVA